MIDLAFKNILARKTRSFLCVLAVMISFYLNGSTELAIMRQTGHRSLATLRRYIRDSSLFGDNAAGKLGL